MILMACKSCASENQRRINAELALTPPTLQAMLRNVPVYLVQKADVCFECGFLELKVPKRKLAMLKRSKAA